VLVIDRDSFVVELFSLEGDAFSRATGPVRLTSLGTTIATIDGPGLRVTWDGGSADVVV
jgi:hypothetical protein